MKFTKPQLPWGYNALCAFIESLPAEFEIVEPGNVQVRWPEGLNRERIIWLLQHPFSANFGELHGLAKIAPSMKKPKRAAELWLHVSGQKLWKYPNDNWRLNSTGWRKVGECEVDE